MPTSRLEATSRPAFLAPAGQSVRLDGPLGIRIRVRHSFAVTADGVDPRRWNVTTLGYFSAVLDADDRELLAYHWHRDGHSPITFPHHHVGAPAGATDISKLHLPTGIVPLAAVIRLVITELGVEPRHPKWRSILDSALRNGAAE